MTITKLTITNEDICEAVGEWLTKKGISLPLERVYRTYSWEDFQVEFKEEEKQAPPTPAPLPTPAPIEVQPQNQEQQ